MAPRQCDREKARQWDRHISHCSRCFNDFVAFREVANRAMLVECPRIQGFVLTQIVLARDAIFRLWSAGRSVSCLDDCLIVTCILTHSRVTPRESPQVVRES